MLIHYEAFLLLMPPFVVVMCRRLVLIRARFRYGQ